MMPQFKKFLIFLISLGLAGAMSWFFGWAYLSSYVGASRAFVFELGFMIPVIFYLGASSSYSLLTGKFSQTIITKRGWFTFLEWVVATFLLLGFSLDSLLLTLAIWIAIFGLVFDLLRYNTMRGIMFWLGIVILLVLILFMFSTSLLEKYNESLYK